jgi:hypothetical protein
MGTQKSLHSKILESLEPSCLPRHVLTREGATQAISGMFYYKVIVVQSVLLYGCETWTITRQC